MLTRKRNTEADMRVNLSRQINNLSAKTTIHTVLSEAVVNSIQAGATEIAVNISRDHSQKAMLDTKDQIYSVQITDNGDGFTEKNRNSFSEYGSEHKLEKGCKGIGRVSYLRLFDYAVIESMVQKENANIRVKFTRDFSANDFSVENNQNILSNHTTLNLIGFKGENKTQYSLIDIKEKLYEHILPMLFLNKDHPVEIKISDTAEEYPVYIKTNELPAFPRVEFDISTTISSRTAVKFKLDYAIIDSSLSRFSGFYCANMRVVCAFSDKSLKINPVDKKYMIFLLSSDILDNSVNNERNDFAIKNTHTELDIPLSWDDINDALISKIKDIIYKAFPDLIEKNKRIVEYIRNEHLHLTDYMQDIDVIGGLIDQEEIIQSAEKEFLADKKKFRETLGSGKSDTGDILKAASDLAAKELTEYVLMRDKIISQLETLDITKEKDEAIIHGHFLKRNISGDRYAPIAVKENNIWLLDDKFMTYNYMASEKTLNTLLKGVGPPSDGASERPDIAIYSNSHDAKRIILVEFKKFSANYKENGTGVDQLYNYALKLKEVGIEQIYLYLIADIDNNFRKMLTGSLRGFSRVFSQDGELYQRGYEDVNAYIQIITPKALISDARARNKTFIDMIKENIPHHIPR